MLAEVPFFIPSVILSKHLGCNPVDVIREKSHSANKGRMLKQYIDDRITGAKGNRDACASKVHKVNVCKEHLQHLPV